MRKLLSKGMLSGAAFAFILLLAQQGYGADDVRFFKNYFVTGGDAVAGVGLRGTGVGGWATRSITMSSVPCTLGSAYVPCNTPGAVPADVIAAFLYWQTVEGTPTPTSRIGYFNGEKILGKLVGESSACWSSGGTNSQYSARVYRADVLRRLSIDPVNNVRLGNGLHTVKLIDSGGGGNGNTPYTNGASLVVVYRVLVPGNPTFAPLRSVVIHDGGFTIPKDSTGMTLQAAGFFQAAPNADAKMTQIVANGQSGFRATLQVDGTTLNTQSRYTGALGGSWDNPTFDQINLAEGASQYTTTLRAATNQTCLGFVAQVTDLKVKDSDADGLLDIWEDKGLHQNDSVSPATFGSCQDYPSDCVNLPAMGASKTSKDIFVELDWMHGDDGHLHVPKLGALYKVACAFAAKGIAIHFDVGSLYPDEKCLGNPKSFIVPAALAQGGEVIEESSLRCPIVATQDNNCAYNVSYSVLSYKTGFRIVKDGFRILRNGAPVVVFPRRFAHNRKDVFHYGLFAHALAGPFNPSTGQPLASDPASVSGVGDRPGGDFMVTLGRWASDDPVPCNPAFNCNNQTGSEDQQAGTIAHELGHNLFLSHAGNTRSPSCAPNYPSVMNYAYQVRLLTDQAGNSNVDFSDGTLNPMNETALPGAPGAMGPLKYRVRFFGPPINPHEGVEKAYCGGGVIVGGPGVRLQGPTVNTPDWNRNNAADTVSFDANYDGPLGGTVFKDSNDWASINLQQISARLNSNGLSADVGALDLGALDLGALDLGALDLGALDLGALDLGALDLGALDLGALDLGALDLGALDLGALDLGALDLGAAAGDVSYAQVSASPDATSSSRPLTATDSIGAITLAWGAPPARVRRYDIYRSDDGINFILLNSTLGTPPPLGYSDSVNDFDHSGAACPNITTKTCYNKTYTYYLTTWALSEADGLVESAASDMVTGEVKHAFVIGNNQGYVMYGVPVPLSPPFSVFGEFYGTLSGVSCDYSPGSPRNAGSYTISCGGGPSSTSEVISGVTHTSGVTYNQPYNDGTQHTPGSLTITKRPITVTAKTNMKVYDGTTSANAIPTIPPGSLVYTDSPNFTETYDNKNAGTSKTLTPAGSVSDGNSGNNYDVTFVSVSTGVITQRPITVTADAKTKFYSESDPPLTYQITNGSLANGDSFGGGLTRQPGENVGAYNILQGTLTAGSNYNLTFVGALFTIKLRPITFIATGSMGSPRSFHTATLLNNGKVLVAGGFDAGGGSLATTEIYDPGSGTFTPTGNNMPNKAAGHTATLLPNGKVLVVGGGNSSSEIYDSTTNSWSSGGGISGSRTYHTATLLPNGKVLIAGGSDGGDKTLQSAMLYDPATGAFSNTGDMTVSRDFHTATLLPNGKVLIAGGRNRTGKSYTYLSSAELYDPATGVFTPTASPMLSARYGHTAIEINGKILITNGANTGTVAGAELYDPATRTFAATSSTNTPRQYFTATIFGSVVVEVGGLNGSSLSTAEQYVGTAFIVSADSMIDARAAHTATLLNGGTAVLITGGQGSAGTSINKAELLKFK